MRTFISAVAVILALLLAAVSIPAAWIDANIVREDGFVALTSGLGKDESFQRRLVATTVGSLEASVDLPAGMEGLVASALEKAATGMHSWPEYPVAWEDATRNSHRLNFPAAAEDGNPGSASTSLVLDVGPLAGMLAARVSRTIGIPVAVPENILIDVGAPAQRQLVERLAVFAPLWWIPALGALVALALAFAAARRRSGVALFSGLGLAAVVALWTLASGMAGVLVGDPSNTSPIADLFKREFVSACQSGFAPWINAALLMAGLLFVAGAVGWGVTSRKRRPGEMLQRA